MYRDAEEHTEGERENNRVIKCEWSSVDADRFDVRNSGIILLNGGVLVTRNQ